MTSKKHGVHFDITAENATDRAFRAVENNLGAVSRAAAKVGSVMQGAFLATAAIAAGKAFAEAAIEAEQASKRLDVVLKATGNSAGLTKKQLDGMADSMAESTQFDDEGLRNAQAQMLKFGNIHGETFGKAMELSADLAAFMGTDLNSAVQAVGKALTSPTEGITALERQVGKFNPAAKAMINNLAESGNEAKAQAAVLDVLTGKVGGAAEALNSGLFKAAGGVTKQWNEMLEAFGKTSAFQAAAKSSLGVVEQGLRDIKEIIENGTWYEKLMALWAMQLGFNNFKLTPAAPDATNNVKGKIRGVVDPGRTDDPLSPPSEAEWKGWMAYFDFLDKKREKAKQQKEKDDREYEQNAMRQVEMEEQAARETAEAWDHWGKIQLENEKIRNEDRTKMWEQVYETIDREQDDAREAGRVMLEGLEDQAKKDSEAAREFGLVMVSAFEDAVVGGKKLKDVLSSLGQDLAKMVLRKGVTEPLANMVGEFFKGFSFGGGGGSNYADFAAGGIMTSAGPVPLRSYAGGGVASSPQLALFGEGSRPEAYVPLPDGRRIPVDLRGGGGGGVPLVGSINIHVESTGDAQQDGEIIAAKVTEAMRGVARSEARMVIGDELRPGGLLR